MTRISDHTTNESDSVRKPSFSIVNMACNEVSAMFGAKDRSTLCDGDGSGEGGNRASKEYECMGRIARIPLVKSTASAISNFYTGVKQSHCMVQTLFENVEEGWNKSADAVGPVTSKLEGTLETPLRVIDNAACVGLDFIEAKVSSFKLPPEKMYENSKDYMNRRLLAPVVEFTCTMLESVKSKIPQYAIKPKGNTGDKENREDNVMQNTELVNNDKK